MAFRSGRSQAPAGCRVKTVAAVAREMNVPALPRARVLPGETVAHILARHRGGRDAGTIARELQIDATTVRAVIRRNSDVKLRPDDTIMRAIKREMARRGIGPGKFVELLPPPPTRETVYQYLSGERSPGSEIASRMLAALDLRIVRVDGSDA